VSAPNPFATIERKRISEARGVLRANPELRAEVEALTQPAVSIGKQLTPHSQERQWPAPLASQAFHGIAGEIVHAIEPHTEADPAALLIQFLVGFGNLIGRGAHTTVEADRHGCNLFAAIVGVSAKGRKGTSWGQVRCGSFANCLRKGLSSRFRPQHWVFASLGSDRAWESGRCTRFSLLNLPGSFAFCRSISIGACSRLS
jgi:hypothetical protein